MALPMIAVARPKKKTMTRYSRPIGTNCGGSAGRAAGRLRPPAAARARQSAERPGRAISTPSKAETEAGAGAPHSSMAIPKVTPTQAELDSTKPGGKHRAGQARAEAQKAQSTATQHHGTWNDKHWRWVETPDGDWRVQGYIFHHKHKPPKHHFRGPGPKPPVRQKPAPPPRSPRRRRRTTPHGLLRRRLRGPPGDPPAHPRGLRPRPGTGRRGSPRWAWSARSSR